MGKNKDTELEKQGEFVRQAWLFVEVPNDSQEE